MLRCHVFAMPPAKRSHLYATLGIHRESSELEVRAAYRRRALETHPDKGGDHEAFLGVIHAFEILSDPAARKKYDLWLESRRDRDGLQVRGRHCAELSEERKPVLPPKEPRPPDPQLRRPEVGLGFEGVKGLEAQKTSKEEQLRPN